MTISSLFPMPHKHVKNLAAVIFWLLVWEGASLLIANSIVLVSPRATFATLARLALTAPFWQNISFSLMRILLGFFLALFFGVVLAAFASWSKIFYTLILPAINVMKSVPVASFTLIALMWIARANLSVFIAFVTVLPIVFFNTHKGIETTPPPLLEMANLFRVGRFKKIRHIYLQATLPYILSAAGTGLGFAWKSGIAAELIGGAVGSIGFSLHMARNFLLTADLFAWTITIVLLSYVMEKAFMLLLGRVAKWL